MEHQHDDHQHARKQLDRSAGVTFASDTVSITTMEIVDNAFILIVPERSPPD